MLLAVCAYILNVVKRYYINLSEASYFSFPFVYIGGPLGQNKVFSRKNFGTKFSPYLNTSKTIIIQQVKINLPFQNGRPKYGFSFLEPSHVTKIWKKKKKKEKEKKKKKKEKKTFPKKEFQWNFGQSRRIFCWKKRTTYFVSKCRVKHFLSYRLKMLIYAN